MNNLSELSIPEILSQYPQTESVFEAFGIKAVGYRALELESLTATCIVHQIELSQMLTALLECLQLEN